MLILAQALFVLFVALIAILCWRGFRIERNVAFRAGLILLVGLVIVATLFPEVYELSLTLQGVPPSWDFRYETLVAAVLAIWHAREWAYGH